jgi:murein DD-endopeptidase MepM/ murein hydrolase activator NlpD
MISIKEKKIEGVPGYAIFLDNIRIDDYVKSWSTSISIDGSMSSASIEMIYVPDFYRVEHRDEATGEVTSSEKGIDNMTNLKIFSRNMFTNNYVMIFDGNIRGKTLSKSGGMYSLSFSGTDYMNWFNRTIVPLSVPLDKNVVKGDRLKWKAQGIDVEKVKTVVSQGDASFRGKTLTEFIEIMKKTSMTLNKIYSNKDTVAYWDNALDRLKIMADLKENFISNKVIDFVVTSSASFVNSFYVAVNDVVKNLMYEFFQDRDGVIRIKPPFWNEPVLKDHIIDPSLIMSLSESINWNNYFTRIVASGGNEEFQDNMTDYAKALLNPVAAFMGSDRTEECWQTDSTMESSSGQTGGATSSAPVGGGGTTGTWLDSYRISQYYGVPDSSADGIHGGIDYALPMGTPIKHVGGKGLAYQMNQPGGAGLYVHVKLLEGPFKGYTVEYMHLSKYSIMPSSAGVEVTDGTVIGECGSTGRSTGPHLHMEVESPRGGTIDPLKYLRESISNATQDGDGDVVSSYGDNKLLEPTTDEKKYGVSVYDVQQPLIKVSNSSVIESKQPGMKALNGYAKFMYHLLNSLSETANVQLVSMPWLRPGFNVWIDPIGLDKVYYIHSISHQGSAEGGIYTSLTLAMGRDRTKFASGGTNFFGALKSKDGENENMFVHKMSQQASDFGKVLLTVNEYKDIRKKCLDFYQSDSHAVISATNSAYFKDFYGNTNFDSSISVNSSSTPYDETYHFDLWPSTMKKGIVSKYVSEVQKILAIMGRYNSTPNDTFDQKTHDGVAFFQKDQGIEPDGTISPATKEALKIFITKIQKATKSQASSSSTTSSSLSNSLFPSEYSVEHIQKVLDTVYSSAPPVVQSRVKALNNIMNRARNFVKSFYVTERG